ncbi:hypothetical protein D5086_025840 [Populus alba]|uniref:Uncharacterized protein n=1 Tax=Populus alba TaxID=43335 RepID=A0ACC4B0S1_POPAL
MRNSRPFLFLKRKPEGEEGLVDDLRGQASALARERRLMAATTTRGVSECLPVPSIYWKGVSVLTNRVNGHPRSLDDSLGEPSDNFANDNSYGLTPHRSFQWLNVSHIQANGRSLSPAFGAEIVEPSGKFMLQHSLDCAMIQKLRILEKSYGAIFNTMTAATGTLSCKDGPCQ